jgi:hypothetical protein
MHSATGLDALGKKKKLPLLEIKLIYLKFSHLPKKNAKIFHPTAGHEVRRGKRGISPLFL